MRLVVLRCRFLKLEHFLRRRPGLIPRVSHDVAGALVGATGVGGLIVAQRAAVRIPKGTVVEADGLGDSLVHGHPADGAYLQLAVLAQPLLQPAWLG